MENNPPDPQVEDWLTALGVDCLCQWDVLVFLYRHLTSLVSAEHIARLLGYPTAEVVTALDGLEFLGLVERSRVDQGVRLYQFSTPADSPRGDALSRLLAVAASRRGRLLLTQKLRRFPAGTGRAGGVSPLRLASSPDATKIQGADAPRAPGQVGSPTWLKAI
jgi:hypothetical protein